MPLFVFIRLYCQQQCPKPLLQKNINYSVEGTGENDDGFNVHTFGAKNRSSCFSITLIEIELILYVYLWAIALYHIIRFNSTKDYHDNDIECTYFIIHGVQCNYEMQAITVFTLTNTRVAFRGRRGEVLHQSDAIVINSYSQYGSTWTLLQSFSHLLVLPSTTPLMNFLCPVDSTTIPDSSTWPGASAQASPETGLGLGSPSTAGASSVFSF